MRKKAKPNLFEPARHAAYRVELLIQLLYDLDCHERSYMIKDLTGDCDMSEEYKRRIADLLKISNGTVAFWGFDYLLDWLHAALFVSQTEPCSCVYDNVTSAIRGNNEDLDVLLAVRTADEVDLVMIEAKVEVPFDRSQLASKVERLGLIFGTDGRRYPSIHPHFLLASPSRSLRIDAKDWPRWMVGADGQYIWYEIRKNFHSLKVTRCDSSATPSRHGSSWILEGRKGVKLSVSLAADEREAILRSAHAHERVKLPLKSFNMQESTATIDFSIPDLISIIKAVSCEAEQADQTGDENRAESLWDLHDRLSTLMYDEGLIVSDDHI